MAISSEATIRTNPPLLLRERRRRASCVSRRSTLTHNDWRKLGHLYGYIDPERTWRARVAIGELWRPFYGIFGNAHAVNYMPYHTARIIRFPAAVQRK
jgi:hypothetical protein